MRILCVLIFMISLFRASAQVTSNDPEPVFTSIPIGRVAINESYTYTFQAIDSLGRPLAYSAALLPSWLTMSGRTITGKPIHTGQSLVHLQVSNGARSTTQDFAITVYDQRTINILPLGNSITNGTDKYDSYRRPLWKLLHDGGYNFDFVGSWSSHHMGDKVPDPDFDMDHEGHSGWNTGDIFVPPVWDSTRGNVNKWLKLYVPDIVLIELGTNDVFQCKSEGEVFNNLTRLISTLRAKNDQVKIFLGSVLPMGARWGNEKYCGAYTLSEAITSINKKLKDFAVINSVKNSPLVIVDHYPTLIPEKHLYDAIHPNEAGQKIMAANWLQAIKTCLPKL